MRCPQCGEAFENEIMIGGRVSRTCRCGCRVLTEVPECRHMDEGEVLAATIRKNGRATETLVAIEEMSELTKELVKDWRDLGDPAHIAEEMADVEICMSVLKMIHKNADDVAKWKECKLRRLEEDLRGGVTRQED